MNNLPNRELQVSGTKGELFFWNVLALILFGTSCSELIDKRKLYREGDFLWRDLLIEIKDDTRCRSTTQRPTGNIPIEMSHSGHDESKGWFYHCIENGVALQVFMLFRSEKKEAPCRTIIAPFSLVRELVEQHANEFKLRPAKDPKDGSLMMLLCIPEERFIKSCDAMVFKTDQAPNGELTVNQVRESKWEQEVFGNVR